MGKVTLSSFQLKNVLKFVPVWSAREQQNILTPHMFTCSHANTSLGQSERARTILVIYKRCYQLFTWRWGTPHLSRKRDQIKMRDYMYRRVTHQSGLPHLPGVPHLHVNRPLDFSFLVLNILAD